MKAEQVEKTLLRMGQDFLRDADCMRVEDPELARKIYLQGRDFLLGSGRFTPSMLPATLPRSVSLVPVKPKPAEPEEDFDAPTERLWELLQVVRDDLDKGWTDPPPRRSRWPGLGLLRTVWNWLWGERGEPAYA